MPGIRTAGLLLLTLTLLCASLPAHGQAPSATPTVDTAGAATPSPALEAAAQSAGVRVAGAGGTATQRLVSLLGVVAFLAIAWGLSVNRSSIPWRAVLWGTGLQFVFAALILLTTPGRLLFQALNDVFTSLLGFTGEGARFIFGNLVQSNVPVGSASGPEGALTQSAWANTGAYFAFSVLPTIVFFASLMAVLYHLGLMQLVVRAFAWVMRRSMRVSGAESLSAAGNIFVGQTEAPLLVKPFVARMTNSELHAVMTGGFATVAGGVMAAYVGMLALHFPDIAGHLIAASVMSAPAALAVSKLMYPEAERPETQGEGRITLPREDENVIGAAARGAGEGLGLALNVGAMLLAFIALLALLNALIGWAGGVVGLSGLSLQQLLGWVCAPLAWLMGTPWADAVQVGTLLGEKTALNEFVAYLHLAEMLASGAELSPRSVVIATYALCGFANFSSIAVQIGGISAIAPARRGDLARLGLRAMVAGTLATFMTAAVVGVLI